MYNIFDFCKNVIDAIKNANINCQSIARICQNHIEVQNIYNILKGKINISILPADSKFSEGIIITTSYISKGLEFDCVLVYNASEENYKDLMINEFSM